MLLLRTSRGVDPGIPLLRSLGSNAHVWLPGANGVSVASLPSNNYLLSNGSTGYSTVDAVDGLTLDAFNGGASTQTARFTAVFSEHFYTVKGANTLLAGDIEIICQAALTNWQAFNQVFASSDNGAGNYGFLSYIDASGNPVFRYSPDGTAVRTATCSAKFSTVFSAGANGYIRTTYNSVTGDTKFYTAPDGTTWTQLGATVTLTAGTVFNGTGGIAVGAQYSSTTTSIAGSITRLRVYRDLVGTIAVDFNPASYVLGSTSWVSAVGETWTFGGSTISTILPSGIHLTQATSANKPLVRRGMLNSLTYSLDVSNAAWPATNWTNAASDILSPTGDSSGRKLTATAVGAPLLRTDKVATSTTQTFVFVFKDGTYTTPRFVFRNATTATILVDVSYAGANSSGSSAYGTYEFTDYGSNGWKICRITCTSGITIGNSLGLYFGAGGTITNGLYFYAWGGGLFDGAWTAAQIVAEGGITSTTATAASNPSAGKYWWSFDGSNDSLLSGNLGITNACTIVIAGRVNTLPANTVLIGEDVNGVQISIASNGEVSFTKKAVVILVTSAAGTIVAGVPFVITCRLSAGTAVIRKLGAQVATAATAQAFAATTGARIGSAFDTTLPTGGAIGWVVPLPTALSDADCLTVERLVGSQFPGMATF